MWGTGATLDSVNKHFSKKGWQVDAPTLPGHVLPNHDLDRLANYSVRDYRDYLMDHCEIDSNTILVGHSMGGLLAQMIAAKTRVAGMILLASAGPRGTNCFHVSSAVSSAHALCKWKFWKKTHRPGWATARYALWNKMPKWKARYLFEQLTFDSGRAYAEIVFWMFDRNRSIEIDTDSIGCPVLLIAGRKDRIIVPSISDHLSERFPNCEYHLLDNHAHWLFDEPNNSAVYDLIDGWAVKNAFNLNRAPHSILAGNHHLPVYRSALTRESKIKSALLFRPNPHHMSTKDMIPCLTQQHATNEAQINQEIPTSVERDCEWEQKGQHTMSYSNLAIQTLLDPCDSEKNTRSDDDTQRNSNCGVTEPTLWLPS